MDLHDVHNVLLSNWIVRPSKVRLVAFVSARRSNPAMSNSAHAVLPRQPFGWTFTQPGSPTGASALDDLILQPVAHDKSNLEKGGDEAD